MRFSKSFLVSILILTAAANFAAAQSIEYTVSMSEPWTHYYDVTMTISGAKKKHLDFVMPVWIPGSYMVREFSKFVEGFSAGDGKTGTLRTCRD